MEPSTLNVPAAVFMRDLYKFYEVFLKCYKDFHMFNLELPWRVTKGADSAATYSIQEQGTADNNTHPPMENLTAKTAESDGT